VSYNGNVSKTRTILHVDMDAFFAAVEQLDQPDLRGKPVLIGSDRPRGVVATASYEARPFGCHSAQPMIVAKRRCPHAIVVPPNGRRYRQVSRQMFAILESFTPVVEPLSIDEAFLDLTGTQRLLGPPEQIALTIKNRIRAELGLTASVGLAPNKFLAKFASELDKPDGLTVLDTKDVDRVLGPLPIERLWGVGPATAARVRQMGVQTIGDLRRVPLETLAHRLGWEGERFYRLSRGLDQRAVTPDSGAKSIGQEQTFETDVADTDHLRFVLLAQVEQVARRLRKHELSARSVTVKIRFGCFETITRSTTFEAPTDLSDDLWRAARGLFDRWASQSFAPVRLIGATAGQLSHGGEQLDLFNAEQRGRKRRLDRAKDHITDRFGKDAIRRGTVPHR